VNQQTLFAPDAALSIVVTDTPERPVDAVTARLICTYRGTGTQYGVWMDGAQPRRVITSPTGASIALRGPEGPERPASGLMHRSPPIESSGETRLVLVPDPIFDPEEAA